MEVIDHSGGLYCRSGGCGGGEYRGISCSGIDHGDWCCGNGDCGGGYLYCRRRAFYCTRKKIITIASVTEVKSDRTKARKLNKM